MKKNNLQNLKTTFLLSLLLLLASCGGDGPTEQEVIEQKNAKIDIFNKNVALMNKLSPTFDHYGFQPRGSADSLRDHELKDIESLPYGSCVNLYGTLKKYIGYANTAIDAVKDHTFSQEDHKKFKSVLNGKNLTNYYYKQMDCQYYSAILANENDVINLRKFKHLENDFRLNSAFQFQAKAHKSEILINDRAGDLNTVAKIQKAILDISKFITAAEKLDLYAHDSFNFKLRAAIELKGNLTSALP